MKMLTFAGPPSSGKTSVILAAERLLRHDGIRTCVVKFDCLSAQDKEAYGKQGVPVSVGLSGNMCPDHFYVSNVEGGFAWAQRMGADILVSESAGLCNRCSPHIRDVAAVCVVDALSGSRTPRKIGPMLRLADLVVITKGDIVSQAEREVFAHEVRLANPKAQVCLVNGITGQGAHALARFMECASDIESLDEWRLRFTMPSALCSYCMGQTRIGKDYQMGAVREMEFDA
jgi:Ni2+-binding GTPase involved in maturation of urease and hydrogenase